MLYLTPNGGDISVAGTVFPCISLVEAGTYLAGKEEGPARLLSGIIREIYGDNGQGEHPSRRPPDRRRKSKGRMKEAEGQNEGAGPLLE